MYMCICIFSRPMAGFSFNPCTTIFFFLLDYATHQSRCVNYCLLLSCGGYFVGVLDPGLSMHNMDGDKWIDLSAACCCTSPSNTPKLYYTMCCQSLVPLLGHGQYCKGPQFPYTSCGHSLLSCEAAADT